jgi:hypothetical protein
MIKFCQSEISYYVSSDVPKSALNINDDKKVELLLSLMSSLRTDNTSWIDRTYKSAIWSIGILVTAMSFIFIENSKIPANGIIFIAIGMSLFGLVTQLFFCAARNAHNGIGAALIRCEASLRLCESGSYLTEAPFFGYSGHWIPPTHITIMQVLHFIVLILSVLMVASVKFW